MQFSASVVALRLTVRCCARGPPPTGLQIARACDVACQNPGAVLGFTAMATEEVALRTDRGSATRMPPAELRLSRLHAELLETVLLYKIH
jgi:hypothetical protein